MAAHKPTSNGFKTRTTVLFVSATLFAAGACRHRTEPAAADSSYAGVQKRGQAVMGVDQLTSKHVFEDLPDGGRVVLDRDDASDSAAVRTIRAHVRDIER